MTVVQLQRHSYERGDITDRKRPHRWTPKTENRTPLLHASQALGDRSAFLLKQQEQRVHVLFTRAEVHGIDTEPGFPFQLRGRNPEASALLHALRDFGMQLF